MAEKKISTLKRVKHIFCRRKIYSLPHEGLLSCIEAAIDEHGVVDFSNACGVSTAGF